MRKPSGLFTPTALPIRSRLWHGGTEESARQIFPARQFVGEDLKTAHGEKLGKVEDLVIDSESGRIIYGVVNTAGAYRPIPAELLSTGSDNKTVITQATKQQVDSAPALAKNNLAQWSSSSFAAGVYRHYNQSPWWVGDAGASHADKPLAIFTESRSWQTCPFRTPRMRNRKIQNALVDLKSGRVAFLILNPSDILGLATTWLQCRPTPSPKEPAITWSPDWTNNALSAAPNITNNYAELSQPAKAGAIYSYYGKQPRFIPGPAHRPLGGRAARDNQIIRKPEEGPPGSVAFLDTI